MNYSPRNLTELLVGICAVFALVIYFGLRKRKEIMEGNLKLTAQEIWAPLQSDWNLEDLLYGVFHDFSSLETGLMARTFRDEPAGEIIFSTGVRQPWISLRMKEEGEFQATVMPTLQQSVILHVAGSPSQVVCTFSRISGRQTRFEWNSESLECKQAGWGMTQRMEYFQEGKMVGMGQSIGTWTVRGRLVVLPVELPLVVRLFVLALHR